METHFIGSLLCPLDLQLQTQSGNVGPVDAERHREYYKEKPDVYDSEENSTNINTRQKVRRPDQLVSKETLIFLGFTPAKATELWLRWLDAPTATVPWDLSSPANSARRARCLQQDFLDMALEEIREDGGMTLRLCEGEEDNDYSDETLLEYMSEWGIDEKLQETLLVTLSCDIASFGGCSHWVKHIIEMRFFTLTRL